MSLLFDRLEKEHFARLTESDDPDKRRAAEYINESVPVFEITNVAQLAKRLDAFDRTFDKENFFLKPEAFPNFGQPFKSYWMEFGIPDEDVYSLFDVKLGRVGVWCAKVYRPEVEDRACACFAVFGGRRELECLARWVLIYDVEGNILGDVETVTGVGDDEYNANHKRRVLKFFNFFPERGSRVGDLVIDDDVAEVEAEAYRIEAEQGAEAARAYLAGVVTSHEAIVERTHARALDLVDGYLRLVVLPPVLLAHSLLSCKNVGTEEHAPARKLVKARQRRGRSAVKFKTLTIKPTGSARRSPAERISIGGGQTALHLVHGHFKTFTPDAPLFGKHVGKYWWSPMVRGDESAGVVIKDYKMEAE